MYEVQKLKVKKILTFISNVKNYFRKFQSLMNFIFKITKIDNIINTAEIIIFFKGYAQL